jgi:hypothetical protein
MTTYTIDGETYAEWELVLLDDLDTAEAHACFIESSRRLLTQEAVRQMFGYRPRIVTLDDLAVEAAQAAWREEQGF